MSNKIEFIYLSEPIPSSSVSRTLPRGSTSAKKFFGLLAKGDYLMGGPNHNSHGMGIIFPKESPFPNMPVAGPDRRFFAMPAYLAAGSTSAETNGTVRTRYLRVHFEGPSALDTDRPYQR